MSISYPRPGSAPLFGAPARVWVLARKRYPDPSAVQGPGKVKRPDSVSARISRNPVSVWIEGKFSVHS
ncbi:MAG: hypothetical protein JJU13_17210 [Balneolaceae bacterium]|nr:hypothetical protein [Balneolaceae bacterium]